MHTPPPHTYETAAPDLVFCSLQTLRLSALGPFKHDTAEEVERPTSSGWPTSKVGRLLG
jgi:hypothetical protein